jgi:hypothetical protein
MNGSSTTVPNANKHKKIIVVNMCIMNAESKRRSDSRIFGVRITEFGVMARKI